MSEKDPPLVIQKINEWRDRVLSRETETSRDLARRWGEVESRLRADYLELGVYLSDLAAKGETISSARLMQMDRYKRMIVDARGEVNKYSTWAGDRIAEDQTDMLMIGARYAADTVDTLSKGAGIALTFDRVNLAGVDYMIGFSADGAPLNELLRASYPESVVKLTDALVVGLGSGLGPKQTADMMVDYMRGNLDRALLIARTEQLRALRTGSLAQFEKSEVVAGYVRRSQRSANVCVACLALDGTALPSSEVFAIHPNCQCFPQPVLKFGKSPDFPPAREWFDTLPETQQRSMLGPSRYERYEAGVWDWDEAYKIRDHPVWGPTISVTPLRDLPPFDPEETVKGPGPEPLPEPGDVLEDYMVPDEVLEKLGDYIPDDEPITSEELNALMDKLEASIETPPEVLATIEDIAALPPEAEAALVSDIAQDVTVEAATSEAAALEKIDGEIGSIMELSEAETVNLSDAALSVLRSPIYGIEVPDDDLTMVDQATRGIVKDSIVSALADTSGISYERSNQFVKQWSYSANDNDMRSLSIQEEASKIFDVPLSSFQREAIDRLTARGGSFPSQYPLFTGEREGKYEISEKRSRTMIDKLVSSTYANTQNELASQGVEEVVLYRGIVLTDDQLRAMGIDPTGDLVGTVLSGASDMRNPLESWAADVSVADGFSKTSYDLGSDQHSIVIEIRSPASDVYSTARTGQGCLNEAEYILIGRDRDLRIRSFR